MSATTIIRTIAALALVGGAASANAIEWSITDLGTLGDYSQIGGNVPDVNQFGQLLLVKAPNPFVRNSFLYSGGASTELIAPGRNSVDAFAINDLGHVVGQTYNAGRPSFDMSAFVYRDGQMVMLGNEGSYARGINNGGQIVGANQFTAGGLYSAFLYDNGAMINLGSLGSGTSSQANALNDYGQVVGWSRLSEAPSYIQHAFFYSEGKMVDLGTLGNDYLNSEARSINNAGQIVGSSSSVSGDIHAFLYSNGGMIDLGSGIATDINNVGEIVGTSNANAFLYKDGAYTNLNALPEVTGSGWQLNYAAAINDAGQIVGKGIFGGQEHGFLLSRLAAPEIDGSSSILGLSLLAGLVSLTKKRRRDDSLQCA